MLVLLLEGRCLARSGAAVLAALAVMLLLGRAIGIVVAMCTAFEVFGFMPRPMRAPLRRRMIPGGIRQRLDKRRTMRARVKRMMATKERGEGADERRFPFHDDDLTYKHLVTDVREESNAVVMCLMDTSGSMDTMKK